MDDRSSADRRTRSRSPVSARARRAGGALAALLALLVGACAAEPGDRADSERERIEAEIRARFPDVPQLTTAELARELAAPPAERPLLLDARAPEEYAVSRIGDARLAPDLAAALRALEGADPAREVVVYCSVGWRSSSLASELRARGFRNAVNLEGSIFAWANEGRALERDGAAVRAVHPYDEEWGRLLERELWAFSAEPGGGE